MIKTIEKTCKYCGKKLKRNRFNKRLEDFGVFKKRLYCNRECMKKAFLRVGDNYNQKYSSAHATARNINNLILNKTKCENCNSDKNLDIHHKDGIYQNNKLDNLICLCRSCHNKQHVKINLCKICQNPQKGLGYCNKHYIRFKKYGDPYYIKNKPVIAL